MNIVYRYRDGVFECPFYAKKGERLAVKQYDDEWGCRIGKSFMLGDSPKEAIEATIKYLGHTPVDADAVIMESNESKPVLSEEERIATMARIESLNQSAMNWKGNSEGLRDIERKLRAEKDKL